MLKLFISYAEDDKLRFPIGEIADFLEKKGWEVFYYDRDVHASDSFDDYMTENIKISDLIIIVCSENASKASGVIEERGIMKANNKFNENVIIPVFEKVEDIIKTLKTLDKKGIRYREDDLDGFLNELYQEICYLQNREDLINHKGIKLEKKEVKSLKDIEKIIHKGIPCYSSSESQKSDVRGIGAIIEEGHVIYLKIRIKTQNQILGFTYWAPPETIRNLKFIKEIDLSYSYIASLPEALLGLNYLKVLSFSIKSRKSRINQNLIEKLKRKGVEILIRNY